MPDATRQMDRTPDVTVGNQDVPGQMNQPQDYRGQSPPDTNSFTPQVVESTQPANADLPEFGAYPAGIPMDDSTTPPQFPGDSPVPLDTAELGEVRRGKPQFDTDNPDAVPTFERASHDWTGQYQTVGLSPIQLVGRQKGRKNTTIWVPAKDVNGNATQGVVIASSDAELQGAAATSAVVLNVGDSITIESEGAVWVACLPANTTGNVQYTTAYNPAGGELGGQ